MSTRFSNPEFVPHEFSGQEVGLVPVLTQRTWSRPIFGHDFSTECKDRSNAICKWDASQPLADRMRRVTLTIGNMTNTFIVQKESWSPKGKPSCLGTGRGGGKTSWTRYCLKWFKEDGGHFCRMGETKQLRRGFMKTDE